MLYRTSLIALLLSILIGCGREERTNVDSKYRRALDLYLMYAPNDGFLSDLESIETGEVRNGATAHCTIENSGARHIVVKDGIGESAYLDATIAHELAHCLHGADHVADESRLMYEFPMPGSDFWQKNLESELVRLWID